LVWSSPAAKRSNVSAAREGIDSMRRSMAASKRAAKRVDARIAGFVVVALLGGFAVWQCMSYTRPASKGPTKQISIGAIQSPADRSAVQPAVASLSDEQLPATGGGSYRLMQYGQVSDAPSTPQPPQMNPYLPANSDPAGGYAPRPATNSR